jgi:hypothetical protein
LQQGSKIIETSGMLDYEVGSSSIMSYSFKNTLQERLIYSVYCTVYTTGGMVVSS